MLSECQSRPKSEDAMSSMGESSIHSDSNPSFDQAGNAENIAVSDYKGCVASVISIKLVDDNEAVVLGD